MPPEIDHPYYGPAIFENMQDSADFVQFRSGLRPIDPAWTTDTTTFEYGMVWQENQHGGMTMVRRGDGSMRKASERSAISLYELTSVPYCTADGRRVMVFIHEVPCALICRTAYYYVEE